MPCVGAGAGGGCLPVRGRFHPIENPIVSGAVAVALGAALALMIPSTRRERKLIGEASDEVKASVREGVAERSTAPRTSFAAPPRRRRMQRARGRKGQGTPGEAGADIGRQERGRGGARRWALRSGDGSRDRERRLRRNG